MQVRFLYPFEDLQTGWKAETGEVKEIKCLTHDKAIFSCTFPLSLGLFFKITEPLEEGKGKMARVSKPKKAATYPSNLDEQFEMLWDTKGKKGAKNGPRGAYEIFKRLAANVDDDTCEAFTKMLMDDIIKNSGDCGYPEMHLTTYLNQERWVR